MYEAVFGMENRKSLSIASQSTKETQILFANITFSFSAYIFCAFCFFFLRSFGTSRSCSRLQAAFLIFCVCVCVPFPFIIINIIISACFSLFSLLIRLVQ